jgi:hypothetical protein
MAGTNDYAMLLMMAASVRIALGDIDGATALLDEVDASKEGFDTLKRLALETRIANALNSVHRFHDTARRLRVLIPEAEASLGKDHPALAPALAAWCRRSRCAGASSSRRSGPAE